MATDAQPHQLLHLATRIFNTPLLIEQSKLDVVMAVLAPRLGLMETPDITAQQMGSRNDRKPYEMTQEGIAVVDVCGMLMSHGLGLDMYSGMTGYDQIGSELAAAVDDSDVKAILLRFDSNGGETSGAFDLADQIRAVSARKPVWSAVDDNCFSAAYLLASQTNRIYISKTGGVGSIGIIAQHLDRSAADKQEGLKYTAIYAGAKKNDLNPHEPLSDEARATLQAEIDRLYEMFVGAVARGRGVTADSVKATQAGLFFGDQGVTAGLADKVGNFQEALAAITASVAPKPLGFTRLIASDVTITANSIVSVTAEGTVVPAQSDVPALPCDPDEEECEEAKKAKEASEATKLETPAASAAEEAIMAEQQVRPDAGAAAGTIGGIEIAAVELSLQDRDQIAAICAIAKLDMKQYQSFVAQRMSPARVSEEVLKLQKDSEGSAIASHVSALPVVALAQIETAGASIAQQRNLTKAHGVVEAMKTNPALYAQYRADLMDQIRLNG